MIPAAHFVARSPWGNFKELVLKKIRVKALRITTVLQLYEARVFALVVPADHFRPELQVAAAVWRWILVTLSGYT